MVYRRKQYSYSKFKVIPTSSSSLATTSTRRCTILIGLQWCANTWIVEPTWSTSLESASNRTPTGSRMNSKKWLFLSFQLWATCSRSASAIVTWNQPIFSCWPARMKWRLLTSVNRRTTLKMPTMAVLEQWRRFEVHLNTWVLHYGRPMLRMVEIPDMLFTTSLNPTYFHVDWSSINAQQWRMLQALIKEIKSMMVRN